MSGLLAAAVACEPARLSDLGTLAQVLWQFLSLSLFSLGGGNTLLAEYHHLAVAQFCWLTNTQFADLYALAEAAPGPSSMLVGLLGLGAGWREGPFWALLCAYGAEAAILLPSTLLMVMACLSWKRLEHSPWRVAFERGLGPITLGILFAVGLKILRTADTNWAGVVVSVLVCVLMLRTRISPLWFMAVAGVLGGLGVINR
ncbi:chromate transporter [Cyanobium sp. A1C-AMD]|uniref:chromate transporter n=1 Tax=unclassified Cyanobium TaxID=2627006 RepID=UPI0020CC5B1F|nr:MULTISPECIES: chromate transporter [unclassified Cyanobium]MCP9823657.1 chromate transporter [Cyanobium sp. L1E-Cus]MCP9880226.1 chromate transporter [Cyanobium sp. A1C-AMD]MCX5927040.1 chromate transporter [Cyanobium sp. LacPavin_0920_WC12_MAG_63_22]